MGNLQQKFRRMLFFDSVLSLGGISLAALFFVVSLEQQSDITRQVYEHPFVVSNAAQDLKMQILDLRNRLLELSLQGRTVAGTRLEILERRKRIAGDLEVINKYFLGDPAAVTRLNDLTTMWESDQELTIADLLDEHSDLDKFRAGHGTDPVVDELLLNTDQVLAFARARAFDFVAQSEASQKKTRRSVFIGAALIALAHLILLSRRNQAKKELFDQLHTLAVFDELTGAKNRRSFLEEVRSEMDRSKRLGHTLSLIAIDLDDFKKINDTHGHAAGDAALRAFSVNAAPLLRQIDTLGRIGGEEFAILLPGSCAADAAVVAERLRAHVASLPVRHGAQELALTVSVGVVELAAVHVNAERLMADADRGLYAAKRAGKNCVMVFAPTLNSGEPGGTSVPARVAAGI